MSHPDFDQTAARADLCRLLSACYYEPGPEFSEERLFDAIVAAAHCLDSSLVEQAFELKAAFEAANSDDLLVDYAKLFLGPGQTLAPPYESAWRDKSGDFATDSTQALIELDEDRYYRPAYFGDGWVGIRLDLGDTDWDAIGEWLRKSWLAVAPKKLAGLMGVADEF